jgi:hypothetical protein
MKIYKKINQNLLENRPEIWSSRLLILLFMGVGITLFSFVIGFLIVDQETLHETRLKSYYFYSGFITVHIILSIISLLVWMYFFFRNNPSKNFYPLSPFYFQKLFIRLVVGFLFISGFSYYTFTYGVYLKANALYSHEEVIENLTTLQRAEAFLLYDKNDYSFTKKIYPNQETNNYFLYNEEKYSWNLHSRHSIYNENSFIRKGSIRTIQSYQASEIETEKEPITIINNHKYKFFKTKKVNLNDKIYVCFDHGIDLSHLKLKEYSIENFNSTQFRYKGFSSKISPIELAKQNYEIAKKKDTASIRKILIEFKSLLNKHHVEHRITPELVCKYLEFKNYQNLNVITKRYNYEHNIQYENQFMLLEKEDNDFEKVITLFESNSSQYIYFDKLETYFENYANQLKRPYDKNVFSVCLVIVSILAAFFILLQLNSIKNILVSAIVALVIFLLVLFFFIQFHIPYQYDEILAFLLCFSCMITIFLISLNRIKNKHSNKSILNIGMTISYCSSTFILILVYIFIYEIIRINYQANHPNTYYDYPRMEPSFYMIYLLGILGYFGFLTQIKKWVSREE